MNRILIAFLTIWILGCNTKQKNEINKLQPQKDNVTSKAKNVSSNLIIDTLTFEQEMAGHLLAEKYAFGLEKLPFYKQFISENKILEKQILTDQRSETEITYLGKLRDLDNQHFYHALTDFKIVGIGEMESPRGISNIVFLDEHLEKAIIYRMGIPDDLPLRIENQRLLFYHKPEKIGITISGGLPPILCIPKIGCH